MSSIWTVGILGALGGFLVPIVGHLCSNNKLLLRLEPELLSSAIGAVLSLCAAALILLGPLWVFDVLPVTKAGPAGKKVFFGFLAIGVILAHVLGRYLARLARSGEA